MDLFKSQSCQAAWVGQKALQSAELKRERIVEIYFPLL
jgi:hypothetical protein